MDEHAESRPGERPADRQGGQSLLERVRTPAGARIVVLVAVTVAVGLAAVPRSQQVIEIRYVFSLDAEQLLKRPIQDFNRARVESGGKVIHVDWTSSASGEALDRMAELRPAAWTPASTLWVRLLDFRDPGWAAARNPSLVRSPQVIGVWKLIATALRANGSFQFKRFLDLARSGVDIGGEGPLRWGHPDPHVSTSGLSAVVAEFYLASSKEGQGLTIDDVQNPSVREEVGRMEQSIVHYGDIAKDFADAWRIHGPSYASAAYMQETTMTNFNCKYAEPVVPIYPAEGTFVADYPYVVLHAPWATREQQAAAALFGRWLNDHLNPGVAGANGFRRGSSGAKSIGRCGLVDPSQPRKVLTPPSGEVVAAIQQAWDDLRKPANIMLVVDKSDAMAGQGWMPFAQQALHSFLDRPGFDKRERRDGIGLMTFDARVETPVQLDTNQRKRETLRLEIEKLFPQGRSALYDAIESALKTRAMHDPKRINTIIVMANGSDDASSIKPAELIDQCLQAPVQILAVAYGSGIHQELRDVVSACRGRFFEGDQTDSEKVAKFISSFL